MAEPKTYTEAELQRKIKAEVDAQVAGQIATINATLSEHATTLDSHDARLISGGH
jgi:hypothetical protein